MDSLEPIFFSFLFFSPLRLTWLFPLKLRQLLLDSQCQLDEAKSEAQKQSAELALVGWLMSWAGEYGIGVCVCNMTLVCVCVINWMVVFQHPCRDSEA